MKLTKGIACYTYTYMQLYTLCAGWLYLFGNDNLLGSNLADVSFGEMFVSQIFERNECSIYLRNNPSIKTAICELQYDDKRGSKQQCVPILSYRQ